MGRTFSKRNEGKNEAKQKGKPQRSKAIKKQTNINKQSLIYLQFHFSVNYSRRKHNGAGRTWKGNGKRFIIRAILKAYLIYNLA